MEKDKEVDGARAVLGEGGFGVTSRAVEVDGTGSSRRVISLGNLRGAFLLLQVYP